ncbi:MAG: SUMF1/EgtB/PvdO family nonheme iron enzyme [Planctomycetota bacterium]
MEDEKRRSQDHDDDEAPVSPLPDPASADRARDDASHAEDPEDQLLRYPAFARKLKSLFRKMQNEKRTSHSSSDLAAGRVINDFRIIRELGSGGMARVYEAEQITLKRRVALKVLYSHLSLSERAIRKFRREAEAGGRQSHRGIVSVYAVGEHKGMHYIAQELVEGAKTLAHMIDAYRAEPALPQGYFRDIAKYTVEVAEALHHAHAMGVIHRDVKPSNILLDANGRPKVSDFGLAKVEDALALSRTGDFSGTPYYMSPEQALGRRSGVDHRTDIYSLGVTLYESLTLERPFDGKSSHEVLQQISTKEPEEPVRVNPRVPRDLSVICMKAMEKDPGRRYPSMEAMADDLRRFLSGDVILARPASLADKAIKRMKRNPMMSVAVAVAFLSVLALLCLTPWYLIRLSGERNRALESENEAVKRYEEVRRLSDDRRLNDCLDAVETLWPAYPEKIGDMEVWLEDARELVARVDLHRATLAALRENALPYDDEARRQDRRNHPKAEDLEKAKGLKPILQSRISKFEAKRETLTDPLQAEALAKVEDRLKGMRETLGELDALIVEYEREVAERTTWRFADFETEWQHGVLQKLVESLEELSDDEGLVKKIEDRLDFARNIREETLGKHAAEWEEAIAVIADPQRSPLYKGLIIAPQIGFIPLGQDPDSGLYEFSHFQTGAMPMRNEDGRLEPNEANGLVFVLIPGSAFQMGAERPGPDRPEGSPNADPFSFSCEGPVHIVRIEPFLLSKYEMTQGQWKRFTGKNPSGWTPDNKDIQGPGITLLNPVEQVDWFESEKVLSKLRLRLPTEAEWEYAARAGTSTIWFTGDRKESLGNHVNMADAFSRDHEGPAISDYELWLDDGFVCHAPVHLMQPNRFGLHQMAGNVWEWCIDGFRMGGYKNAPADGSADRALDESQERVIRGGGYNSGSKTCRSSYRKWMNPGSRVRDCGLRPACSLDQKKVTR